MFSVLSVVVVVSHLTDDESADHTEHSKGLRDLVRARWDEHGAVCVALVVHQVET